MCINGVAQTSPKPETENTVMKHHIIKTFFCFSSSFEMNFLARFFAADSFFPSRHFLFSFTRKQYKKKTVSSSLWMKENPDVVLFLFRGRGYTMIPTQLFVKKKYYERVGRQGSPRRMLFTFPRQRKKRAKGGMGKMWFRRLDSLCVYF